MLENILQTTNVIVGMLQSFYGNFFVKLTMRSAKANRLLNIRPKAQGGD